jgi:putative inorganic carbon (HCO3(-)) transporter
MSEMSRTAPQRTGARYGYVLAVVLVFFFSVWIASRLPVDGWQQTLELAVGAIGAVVLLSTAYARFELFILLALLVRPMLDALNSSHSATGGSSGILAAGFGAMVTAAGLVWMGELSRTADRFPLSFPARAAVAVCAAMTISVYVSSNRTLSLFQVARTVGAVALLLIVEQLIRGREQLSRVLTACFFAAVVPLAVGLVQLVTTRGTVQRLGLSRIVGTFSHPNSYGFFLALLIIMGTALFRHVNAQTRVAITLLTALSAVELVFTYSRGSWLVLVAGLLVVGLTQTRKLLVILPVGLGVALLVPSVTARLTNLTAGPQISGQPGNSLAWRFAHWNSLLESVNGHILLGIGPGQADRLVAGNLAPHNDFVRMFVETGVLGLLCYVALIVALLSVAVRGLRVLTGLERGLAVGYAGCAVAFVLDSIGANLITQFVLLIYVFTFAAAVTAACRPTYITDEAAFRWSGFKEVGMLNPRGTPSEEAVGTRL